MDESHEIPEVEEPASEPAPRRVWDPAAAQWVSDDGSAPTSILPVAAQERSRTGGAWRAGVIGGVVGAILAAAVTLGVARSVLEPGSTVVERRLAPPIAGGGSRSSVVDIAAKAGPWVVNVNITGRRRSLFGTQQIQGTGSGVIVRSDGAIITNAHVVESADTVEVTLASGEVVPAKILGVDADTDIAVIRAERNNLPPAVIGTARDLKVGELTVAIGSPLGLRQTVTAGIVSALGRTVERPNQAPLVDMIQTDAAVTQGNSGGALIGSDGGVIGINSAIAASPDVGAEGIAFAIPIDIAMAVADELIATGHATHPWLGIAGGNIDEEIARRFGVTEGAVVGEVLGGSPAEKAGLKPQDIIVSFDGKKVKSMDELVVAIRLHKVGQAVKIEIVRGGQRQTLEATLGEKPD
jgi:S1-C subfamily serine protease